MKFIIHLLFLFLCYNATSQTDIRAWYAKVQVWVVWKIELPLPLTVSVYASPTPFSATTEATLIGQPFALDYLPIALKEQVDTAATYRIPGDTSIEYQLAINEGLFVFTPHQDGALYFAVVRGQETQVSPGENITSGAVAFQYDPVHDPVQCHVQAVFPSPFAAGYTCSAMYMWADGRDDYWNSRADFPVMANSAKNGMAGFFIISIPNNLDTTKAFPLSIWLHGGGGTARQSLAGSRPEINIRPDKGILVAHNDDVFGYRGDTPPFPENPSLHFGWRKHWNPFSPDNYPVEADTIINYTQRKYMWIDHWLSSNFNIDTNSIHLHGHSMGTWGATALAKAYPLHYASATLFNNGFRGIEPGINMEAMFGSHEQNFLSNIKNRAGDAVPYLQLLDIQTNASAYRDLPLFYSYHSKNDIGDANYWGPDVVRNYLAADSAGQGMALFWSERAHGVDTGPDVDDHWVSGIPPNMQTITDNVGWTETLTRADLSRPAFFNHRMDPNANDPGDGNPGTGVNGNGDDWGTWGGWHRWDNASIVDNMDQWKVTAWLESNAIFGNDNCPSEQLLADLAIRRPQQFHPQTGELLLWESKAISNGLVLQSGQVITLEDDLVVIQQIILYPENIRKVEILIKRMVIGTVDQQVNDFDFILYPNPTTTLVQLHLYSKHANSAKFTIYDLAGQLIYQEDLNLQAGEQDIRMEETQLLIPGIYLIHLSAGNTSIQKKWIKISK